MMRSKLIRRLLGYGGMVLFLVAVAMFRTPTPAAGWVVLVLALLLVMLAFRKLTCPACGKTMREISAGLKNCPHCGASYEGKPTAQQPPALDSSKAADGLPRTSEE